MKDFYIISVAFVMLISCFSCNFYNRNYNEKNNNDIRNNDSLSTFDKNDTKLKSNCENTSKAFIDTLSNNYRILFKETKNNIQKIYYSTHTEYRNLCSPIYVFNLKTKQSKQIISDDYFKPQKYDNEIILVSIDTCKIIGNHLYIIGNREACGSGWIIEHPIVYIDTKTDVVYGFDECAEYVFKKDNKITMTKAAPTNIETAECSADYEYKTWEETKKLE